MGQRLIDAEAVILEQRRIIETLYGPSIAELKKHMAIDDDLSVPLHALEGYSRAKQFYYGLKGILEAAPTVDAVPVVRCRECKYFESDSGYCNFHSQYYDGGGTWEIFKEDDFCSYGERKED